MPLLQLKDYLSPVERVDFASGWLPRWIRLQHHLRYEWAARFVCGKDVLDIACGSGYGTRILAAAGARTVLGADVDAPSVEAASRQSNAETVSFRVADATATGLPSASLDVITSFETIEHVRDDIAYVREMHRLLRPAGVFLCSTPNRVVMNPTRSIHDGSFNPHHVREYGAEELRRLLRVQFGEVEILGQAPFSQRYVYGLTLLGRVHMMAAVRAHQIRKLITSPLVDTRDRHAVSASSSSEMLPEILVALCRP